MPKALIVLTDLRAGNGTASAIMAYYEGLINRGYQVDFLLANNRPIKWAEVIEYSGSKIHYLKRSRTRFGPNAWKSISKVFNDIDYDIVHVNIVGANASQVLMIAKRRGVPCRIWHSHNTIYQMNLRSAKGLFNYGCDRLSLRYANRYIACSQLAGETRFGSREFLLLRNCIDVASFAFNEERREALRHASGIAEDAFVIGTVARMAEQKNPLFSLQIFESVRRSCPSAIFVWIGDGELRPQIESYVASHGLKDVVMLLGTQNDVAGWYSVMDCFLLPSHFEGLPVVGVEAQSAGLPVYASTMVPQEAAFSPFMRRLSLDESPDQWAQRIIAEQDGFRSTEGVEYAKAAGFDAAAQMYALADAYNRFLQY